MAQVLGHAASDVGAPTEDVVAAPRGAALASAVLPMVIAGLLTGVAAALLTTNALGRVGLLLAGSVLLVMIVELLNTGIETAIDRIGPEWHDLSKRAKDMGSAAVLLSLLLAAGIWIAAIAQRVSA